MVLQLLALSLLASPLEARLPAHTLSEYHFATPPGLESKVNFWKKVYSEYSTNHAVVHDMRNLDVIYEVIHMGSGLSDRAKQKKMKRVRARYKKILRNLARKGKGAKLSREEKRVAGRVKGGYYKAARNVRVQLGQKDRFREGLVRSGFYMDRIKKIFREYGLPQELTVLPHVESSFQLNAYSSAGAAGIWQFTRGTGRRYLKVGYEVDERMDPILATVAAAKLLKQNFKKLGSWPLAITAYNHGLQGMKRAKRRHGADIVRIISHHRGRTFGFASQNFYAEFLAALEVARNYQKYFPGLKMARPLKIVTVAFRHHIDLDTAMKYFRMTKKEVIEFNHSLRHPVLSGQKRIPKGFVFQAPADKYADLQSRYNRIPASLKHSRQRPSKWYTVRRGDSLSTIAARFGTTVGKLKRINHVDRRNRIYAGQVLQLPQAKGRKSRIRVAVADNPKAINLIGLKTVNYKVKRNDNLSSIARRFNTSHIVLAALNHVKDPDTLYPGQVLKVPGTPPSSVRVIKKTDHLLIKSNGRKTKKVDRGEVEGAVVIPAHVSNFKNRPAFLPVVFASPQHKDSMIGTITVDLGETLSHYADWANLPLSKLRQLNHIGRRQNIHYHQTIKVPFSRATPEEFERKRQEFHKAIQEDFFNNYRVYKTEVRKLKKGETLWEISNDLHFVPFWLLSSFNPNRDIYSLAVGDDIIIPLITPNKTS